MAGDWWFSGLKIPNGYNSLAQRHHEYKDPMCFERRIAGRQGGSAADLLFDGRAGADRKRRGHGLFLRDDVRRHGNAGRLDHVDDVDAYARPNMGGSRKHVHADVGADDGRHDAAVVVADISALLPRAAHHKPPGRMGGDVRDGGWLFFSLERDGGDHLCAGCFLRRYRHALVGIQPSDALPQRRNGRDCRMFAILPLDEVRTLTMPWHILLRWLAKARQFTVGMAQGYGFRRLLRRLLLGTDADSFSIRHDEPSRHCLSRGRHCAGKTPAKNPAHSSMDRTRRYYCGISDHRQVCIGIVIDCPLGREIVGEQF